MFRNPFGTTQKKISEPALMENVMELFTFEACSPYMEIFAEINRRINEADLTRMIAMLHDPPLKNRKIIDEENITEETFDF